MKRFAIVGCGTAGLASAVLLARSGHEVSIFERFSEPAAIGAGILIQPSGAAVLRKLGLLESLERTAAPIGILDGRLCSGRRVMDVVYHDLAPDARGLGVHRANLLEILYAAAVNAGVKIRCASEVAAIIPRQQQETSAVLAGGESHGPFDGVVIANGTQSRLRERLQIPQSCKPYPWGALWAICPLESGDAMPDALVQRYHEASVMIGLMPTGRNPDTGRSCVSFFWSLKREDLNRWRETPLDAWKGDVLRHWPDIEWVLDRMTSKQQLSFATYADVRMSRWNEKNVVVIGDAAHGMSPQLGQGTNLALLDAWCLAQCVSDCERVEEAFTMYTDRRRKHLRFYQTASRWLTPMFQSDSRVAAAVRNWSFSLANRLPFARREAVRTVGGLKTGWIFDQTVTKQLKLQATEPVAEEALEHS